MKSVIRLFCLVIASLVLTQEAESKVRKATLEPNTLEPGVICNLYVYQYQAARPDEETGEIEYVPAWPYTFPDGAQ